MAQVNQKILNRYRIRIEEILYFILLAVVGVWFICLNWNTPFMHDDLAYHYYYDNNSAIERPTSETISSFWQLFPSMWNHYNAVNGRFTSHFLIQLFCGLLGKNVFNVFNTIIFLLFIDLIVVLSYGSRHIFPLCLSVLSVVFSLPFPGQTMLWLTGSINYLWSTAFSLVIIKIVLSKASNELYLCFLAFLFGLFAGWMNESITFGIGGGMVLYFFMRPDRFIGTTRCIVLGYILGCVLILLSPGTFNRIASGDINTKMNILQMVSSRIISSVFLMKSLPIVALTCFLLVFVCFKRFRYVLEDASVFVYAFIFNALFCFIVGLTESRVFFCLSVLGTILLISAIRSLTSGYAETHPMKYCSACFLMLLCVFPGLKAIDRTSEYNRYFDDVEKRIKSSSSECVIESIPFNDSRFVYATSVSANRYQFHNRVRAFYYNKEYVCAIPKQLYYSYKTQDLSTIKDDYWIINLDSSTKEVKGISAHRIRDLGLNDRQRIIRYLLGTLSGDIDIPDYSILEFGSESLLIIPRCYAIDRLVITFNNGATLDISCA